MTGDSEFFWVTKEGVSLNLISMGTEHIRNCIKMIDRKRYATKLPIHAEMERILLMRSRIFNHKISAFYE